MGSIRYRPEIDGLRAFAVIPVILFHMKPEWLPGGFLGVDVFFVISGYLITSIILKEFDEGTFSFKRFWERRIRRIVPALSAVTFCTAIAYITLLFGDDLTLAGKHGVSALASVSNFFAWLFTGSYWGATAERSPFLHTWSLSVEEQFYFFMPICLLLGLKYFRPKIPALTAAIIALSFAAFAAGTFKSPTGTFYLLPTRVWELAAGCAAAFIQYRQHKKTDIHARRTSQLALPAGLLLILASYVLIRSFSPATAIPVLGTTLILIAPSAATTGIAGRVLSSTPAVAIGKISYSLYLWHWPVIVLSNASESLNSWSPSLITQGVAIQALSLLTYLLIEQPARKPAFPLWRIGAGFAAALIACITLWMTNPYYDIRGYATPEYRAFYYDNKPSPTVAPTGKLMGIHLTPRDDNYDRYLQGGMQSLRGETRPRLVVLGDSHAGMWCHTLDTITEHLQVPASFYSMDGVRPFLDRRNEPRNWTIDSDKIAQFDKARVQYIKEWAPDVVVLSARWSYSLPDSNDELFLLLRDNCKHVLIPEQPPELPNEELNTAQYLAHHKISPEANTIKTLPENASEAYTRGQQFIEELVKTYPNFQIIRTRDLFIAKNGEVEVLDGNQVLYIDDDHLSEYGAQRLRPRFEAAIKACLQDRPQ